MDYSLMFISREAHKNNLELSAIVRLTILSSLCLPLYFELASNFFYDTMKKPQKTQY